MGERERGKEREREKERGVESGGGELTPKLVLKDPFFNYIADKQDLSFLFNCISSLFIIGVPQWRVEESVIAIMTTLGIAVVNKVIVLPHAEPGDSTTPCYI